MNDPTRIRAAYKERFRIEDGKTTVAERGFTLEKPYTDEEGHTQIFRVWISVDEAKGLAQELVDLARVQKL